MSLKILSVVVVRPQRHRSSLVLCFCNSLWFNIPKYDFQLRLELSLCRKQVDWQRIKTCRTECLCISQILTKLIFAFRVPNHGCWHWNGAFSFLLTEFQNNIGDKHFGLCSRVVQVFAVISTKQNPVFSSNDLKIVVSS